VRPVASAPYPGIVLLHEWWGLNEQIKGVADRLAEEGFVVLVPDLFRGKLGTDAGWAHQLARDLDETWALEVIGDAADWLRRPGAGDAARPPGTRTPVATVGFGLGGKLSLQAALRGKPIQAAAMIYGEVEPHADALRPLEVPLLGIFADEDRRIPRDGVKAFEAALKEAGKDATIVIFRGVGHGFFNETRPNFEKDAIKPTWDRLLPFLREKLGVPAPSPGAGPAEAPTVPGAVPPSNR
jgi:carboxymethylenebutenolidase